VGVSVDLLGSQEDDSVCAEENVLTAKELGGLEQEELRQQVTMPMCRVGAAIISMSSCTGGAECCDNANNKV
jgi:hypothetical protein